MLEILWQVGQPLTAYALIPRLEAALGRAFKPPTVYRALDFLVAQRLVTRIESLNAYVPCCTPGLEHTCIFLLCNSCGAAREISDPGIENLMARDAEAVGFHVGRRVVELHGICASCRSSDGHPPAALS